MNRWYVIGIELLTFFSLIICFIILLIMLIMAKRRNKATRIKSILLSLDIILLACSFIFVSSHSTYYKYNDWAILDSNIASVYERYGAFDIGSVRSGRLGYYIYTDTGPFLPDHADHYYWIHFDENGNIYQVDDGIAPGG